MNIAHVLPALTKGGAERVVVDLANQAAADGHRVTLVLAVPRPDDLQPSALRPDVELRFVRSTGNSVKAATLSIIPWALRNWRWICGQDIIHCHLTFGSAMGSVIQLLRTASGSKRPVIVETNHAVGAAIGPLRRRVLATMLRSRDAVAFVAMESYWRASAVKPANAVILNGISKPQSISNRTVGAYRRSLGIPANSLVVGSIGRLVHERRPDLIMDAFRGISEGLDADVHMLFGGDGAERERLEAEAAAAGLSGRVHFPGLVLDPAEPFKTMDLYLTVNVGPATGIAAIEAAMSGLPVIAVQLDQSYARSPDDWIWSAKDPGEVAQHAIALLGDATARAALAAKQRAHAFSNHSVERMYRDYQRLYDQTLATREKSGRKP